MRHIKCLFCTIICLTLLCSCRNSKQYEAFELFAMDTIVDVQVSEQNYDISNLEKYISQLESMLSRTIKKSEISQINTLRSCKVSDEAYALLQKSVQAYNNTSGAFDICSGALTDLWNIPGGNTDIPSQNDIVTAIQSCGADSLMLENGVVTLTRENSLLDLGGIAKGYAAQKCIQLLKSDGIENAMISFGGNVAVTGTSQGNAKLYITGWNIGIKNPDSTSESVGTLNVTDTVIAVSGDYERYFEKENVRYCHIFDTKSGYPANSGLRSVAIVCQDGAIADALSTALFVMGANKAHEFYNMGLYDFEAILITSDGNVLYTDGLSNSFTPNTNAKSANGKPYSYISLTDHVSK